jgi:hexosaminidase
VRSPLPRPRRPGITIPPIQPVPAAESPAARRTATAVARLSDVLPAPVSVQPTDGLTYTLPADATIRTTASADALAVGRYLAGLLRPSTGYPLPVTTTAADGPTDGISLLLSGADAALGAEGYELRVGEDRVVIHACSAAGLFYGVQTLRQLLPAPVESAHARPGPWIFPGGRIVDHPRFAYRGAMLDVSRHFFPVDDVIRYLDQLALYKINHLHLHLTDDQGWRIAVDSWPRLAEIGGATGVDGGPGGFYTKAQYRKIVAHAAARHITIVPEIDLPGHTNAALAAYGSLARDGVAPPPYTGTDVGFSALRVDTDLTYDFIADVLGEVAALTPGPYLHVGGDEAFTMPPADYATFMNRVQPIVTAHRKTVIGWHQVAPADHEDGRVVQFWGTTPADPDVVDAVRRGARVVLSPANRTYLDMKYTSQTPLGKDWAGLVEVRQAYDWDPGSYLAEVPADAVLGVEAPLWTETIATMGQVEFMTFPRLPAIAELGWSPASTHDWESFRQRLAGQGPRWIAAGIAFHPSPQVPWVGAPADVAAPAPGAAPAGSPIRIIGPVTGESDPAGEPDPAGQRQPDPAGEPG